MINKLFKGVSISCLCGLVLFLFSSRFLKAELVASDAQVQAQCDLVVFSYNRPMQLFALLQSIDKRIQNLGNVYIVYRVDAQYEEGYKIVKDSFPSYSFFQQSTYRPEYDFKPIVMDLVFGSFGQQADYIVFAVDDIIITEEIDIQSGIAKLEETGAYGLYYRLGFNTDFCYMTNAVQGIPPLLDVGNGYYSWMFYTGNNDWSFPNCLDFTLYRKKDIREKFEKISFTYPNDLEGIWAYAANMVRLGICCKKSKIVNIPMNVVQNLGWGNPHNNTFTVQELNDLFLKGFRIDIDEFHHIQNRSPHIYDVPKFISQ